MGKMHSLQESLSEYGEPMLQAIAEQWQVAESTPEALAAAMLEPGHLAAFVAGLDEQARAALAQVVAAGGSIRGHWLTRAYGEVRRLGPRAIEREKPWRRPASATERLWYAGLIFRRYGRLGAYHGEVYEIPADLLAVLPPQRPPASAFELRPVAPSGAPHEEGDALALDLEVLLARLRLSPGASAPALLRELRPRWRGSADSERLALLQRLGLRARLLTRRGGLLQAGPQARTWLQMGAYQRLALLFEAWRSDRLWDELRQVPSLHCEETGWRNDPSAARAAVLEALRHCPDGWLRPADLAAALKDSQPDFARPDGDYDSWYIRDVETGQYLTGFAHWDDVEGALIAHLIGRSLYWLGAVALAEAEGQPAEWAFRVTPTGRALLRQTPPPLAAQPAPIAIEGELGLRVPRSASAYDRVRLERFARWRGRQGDDDLYRIEPESLWRALNSGVRPAQVEAFLQRASGAPLPPATAQALRALTAGYGQVTLRRAILLQTSQTETLRLLRSDPELGQRLGAIVSERAILVPEDQLPRVLERLKALGWWPRLDGLAEP